ncbi:MAG: NAD(P)-binding domain-containing protein [Candidatus Latescibacterota bacterium]|nr:NAD(P)-binding domain-containing protein [Candidatus Latescibacterota bacterium]
MNSELEHHTVIVVGGGPAGLPLAVVLGGWHPLFRDSPVLRQRYPQIAEALYQQEGSLLGLDFRDLVRSQIPPVDLFRVLHHPRQLHVDESQIAMEFRRQEALDVLLITQEEVGGLWNNVPEALLTLSPGHWMEFPFYSLATHARESGWVDFDVNELIIKHRLVDYYHRIPERFEVANRIHTWERVVRVEPHERGFLVTSVDVSNWKDADPQQLRRPAFPQSQEDVADAETRQYTCKYLVYAVGQRGVLRELGVPGEHLPFVTQFYDRPEHFPGERVMVVGGGRSADWAATELHDAGRQVNYVMRQPEHLHWALINQSRGGLPYYARIAEILEEPSPRLESLYDTQIVRIDAEGEGGVVTVKSKEGGERKVKVDHLLKEIGGRADYSLLQGFDHGGVKLVDKHDNYRFQVHQLPVHPHNYESIQIPNLYPGGYLAEGLGLVVIAMHGTTYAIAADILRKEGAEA